VSRLQSWLRALGAAGVLGIGILLFCAAYAVSAVLPAERALAAERLAAARGGSSQRVPADPREALRRFYGLFPELAALPEEVARLFDLARTAGLELEQGEYRLESRAEGLQAYRVTLPVRGSYAQIRAFVGALLAQLPSASLDALRFERRKAGEARLEAQLRLTLYFRAAAQSEKGARR
jgi:hypothetical protein